MNTHEGTMRHALRNLVIWASMGYTVPNYSAAIWRDL